MGAFNPAILRPEWFVSQRIIPEADDFSIEMMLGPVPQYRFKVGATTWTIGGARITIEPSGDADAPPNLAAVTFQKLEHTPISAIGYNLNAKLLIEDWKSPRPHLPTDVSTIVSRYGILVNQSHAFQTVQEDGGLLNVTIKEERDSIVIDINNHVSVRDAADAVLSLKTYSDRIDRLKRLVQSLADSRGTA